MVRKQGIKKWLALGLCAWSIGLSACGDDGGGNGKTNNTSLGKDCTGDSSCEFDQYCGEEKKCKDSICVAPPGCEGAACDLECDAGSVCDGGTCRSGCRLKENCAADEVCDPLSSVCRKGGCISTGCDGATQTCDTSLETPTCVPDGRCQDNDDCIPFASFKGDGVDYICDNNGKICIVRPPCLRDNERDTLDSEGNITRAGDCGAGEICEEIADARNVCRQGCRGDKDCLGLNEFCDIDGAFNAQGKTFVCLQGCDSARPTESCTSITESLGGTVAPGQEFLCQDLVCIPTCSSVLSRCTITREGVEVESGQICLKAPQELCSDCNTCQGCTDSSQCRTQEFCDFSQGLNDADKANQALGLCEPLPPACPDDGYGKNTAFDAAFEITSFPFVADGVASAQLAQPLFCNENAEKGEWFKIQAQAGQVITASITYDDAAVANLDLALLTSGNTDIVVSALPDNLDGGQESLRYGVGQGDTFYIQVRGFTDAAKLPYTLSVDVATPPACRDDKFEENDSLGAPQPLPVAVREDGLQVCGSDPDFYLIDADANQIVTIRTFGKVADGNIDLSVSAPGGGTLIASSVSLSDDEFVFFETQGAGQYVVEVIVADGVSNIDYGLEWTQEVNDCSDKYDITTGGQQANNTCAQAAKLSPTEAMPTVESELRLCGDTDWYELLLLPLQKVTVTVTYDKTSAGRIDLRLRGPNNCDNIVARNVPQPAPIGTTDFVEEMTFDVVDGGKYYLVASLNQGLNVKHTLKIEIEDGPECIDDRFDTPPASNDTRATAVPLNRTAIFAGTDNALLGLRYCDNDRDFYSLDLKKDDIVRWVIVHDATATEDLDAIISDPMGSQVKAVTGTVSNEEITYKAAVDGVHTLEIYAKNAARLSYRILTYVTPAGSMTEVGPSNPSCPDQYELNETAATAKTLAPGTYSLLSCNLPGNKDEDWFVTAVNAGDTLTLTADFISLDGNIEMFLYSGANQVSPLVSATGFGDTEEIVYTSAISQNLYYRINNKSINTSNSYILTVAKTAGGACTDDRLAGNTSAAAAANVSAPGFEPKLQLCENTADWFKITLTEGQKAQVYVNEQSIADLDLFAYSNAAGTTLIKEAVGTGEGELLEFTAPDNGVGPKTDVTVWIKVAAKGVARLDYDLIVYRDLDGNGSFGPNEGIADRRCPDQFEDNDTPSNAAGVGPGSYDDLRFCKYQGGPVRGDDDYYNVFVPDQATLTVDLTFLHVQGNIDLEIKRGNSVLVNSISQTDDESATYKNTSGAGETYQVRVYTTEPGNFDVDYAMEVNIAFDTACVEKPASLTGNNTRATAKTITPNAFEGVSLCENTEDWYSISVPAGQQLVVNVELANRLGNIDIELYDGLTLVDQSATSNNIESITFTAPTAKTYLLRVFPRGVIRTEYDLWFSVGNTTPAAPFCADPYERNDTQVSAAPLSWNTQPGNIFPDMIACGGEKDWYSVAVGSGVHKGKVFFDASSGVELDVTIINPQGTVVMTPAQTGNDEFFSFTGSANSTYLIGVENTAANPAVAPYALYFTRSLSPCVEDQFEPNNNPFSAAALPDGEGDYLLSTCGGMNDTDYFTVKATKSGTLKISVAYDPAEFDLNGSVLDPGGLTVNFTPSKNRLTYIKTGVVAGQTYRIDLTNTTGTASGKGGKGVYILRIEGI